MDVQIGLRVVVYAVQLLTLFLSPYMFCLLFKVVFRNRPVYFLHTVFVINQLGLVVRQFCAGAPPMIRVRFMQLPLNNLLTIHRGLHLKNGILDLMTLQQGQRQVYGVAVTMCLSLVIGLWDNAVRLIAASRTYPTAH